MLPCRSHASDGTLFFNLKKKHIGWKSINVNRNTDYNKTMLPSFWRMTTLIEKESNNWFSIFFDPYHRGNSSFAGANRSIANSPFRYSIFVRGSILRKKFKFLLLRYVVGFVLFGGHRFGVDHSVLAAAAFLGITAFAYRRLRLGIHLGVKKGREF